MTMTPTYTPTDLVRRLTSGDLEARFSAATLIGTDKISEAADGLVSRLGSETDCQVRERITWAAVQVIDDALPGLLDALTSSDAHVRMQAAHVLSKAARSEFAPHLHGVVADADGQVAIKGYRAAANTGNPVVIPWLAARIGNGDAHQRDALTNAFVTLGEASIPSLVDALSDDRVSVRAHAAEALGHVAIGTGDVFVALEAATRDPEAEVRLVATTALGQLGEDAHETLRRVQTSDDARVVAVASALLA